MAVREEHDRRVGGSPEKLLTLEEAARRLDLPADDVESMVRSGRLAAFRLGGNLLRVRLKDVELLRAPAKTVPGSSMRRESPRVRVSNSPLERLIDFLHFNDFYLVAVLIILTLLAIIFAL